MECYGGLERVFESLGQDVPDKSFEYMGDDLVMSGRNSYITICSKSKQSPSKWSLRQIGNFPIDCLCDECCVSEDDDYLLILLFTDWRKAIGYKILNKQYGTIYHHNEQNLKTACWLKRQRDDLRHGPMVLELTISNETSFLLLKDIEGNFLASQKVPLVHAMCSSPDGKMIFLMKDDIEIVTYLVEKKNSKYVISRTNYQIIINANQLALGHAFQVSPNSDVLCYSTCVGILAFIELPKLPVVSRNEVLVPSYQVQVEDIIIYKIMYSGDGKLLFVLGTHKGFLFRGQIHIFETETFKQVRILQDRAADNLCMAYDYKNHRVASLYFSRSISEILEIHELLPRKWLTNLSIIFISYGLPAYVILWIADQTLQLINDTSQETEASFLHFEKIRLIESVQMTIRQVYIRRKAYEIYSRTGEQDFLVNWLVAKKELGYSSS